MDNRTLLDLSDEEFKTMIDNYAERGADDFDLETDVFFDALADFAARKRVDGGAFLKVMHGCGDVA